MDFDNIAIGVDIEDIKRFEKMNLEHDKLFLASVFTPKELEYCFSDLRFAQHLAARYCAKEAAVKALSEYNIKDVRYNEIEILNKTDGKPELRVQNFPNILAKVSLAHTNTYAIANVILTMDKCFDDYDC